MSATVPISRVIPRGPLSVWHCTPRCSASTTPGRTNGSVSSRLCRPSLNDSSPGRESMANTFVYRLRVRFCECDPQKVVFNGNFALYIDLAVFEFMRALGFGESLVKGPLDYQVV